MYRAAFKIKKSCFFGAIKIVQVSGNLMCKKKNLKILQRVK